MDNDLLADVFTEQAEWRDEKAAEFPDDERNAEAAAHLRMLAKSAEAVPAELLKQAEEFSRDAPDSEVWNEMLSSIGFSSWPEDATEFMQAYVDSRRKYWEEMA